MSVAFWTLISVELKIQKYVLDHDGGPTVFGCMVSRGIGSICWNPVTSVHEDFFLLIHVMTEL